MLRSMRTQDISKVQELVARDGGSLFSFVDLVVYCLQAGYEAVVADHDGKIVGIAAGKHMKTKSHIDLVCVSKEHRGNGIATSLLSEFKAHAQGNAIYLEVDVKNLAAQRLYASLGYETTQVIPQYYLKSNALEMRAHEVVA